MATKAKAKKKSVAVEKKPANVANAKKTRTGVGAFIKEKLLAGKMSADDIATEIQDRFPESKAGKKEIAWYRSKLTRDGSLKK